MRSSSLASLLLSSFVGWTHSQDTSKPECATACSRDLMHYYNISTMEVLCRDIAVQRELFLCLANSCTDQYGQALTDAISTCYREGAFISNLLPVELHHTNLSPLFARSDTASFGFESRFSLSVDCKAGSDGVLTLSLPEPTPSSAGQPASGGSNPGYGNGNPNVGTNPSTDSSGPDANCEEGSPNSGPLQPGNSNGQPQPQPDQGGRPQPQPQPQPGPAPAPAPPAQNPALPSPPADNGVAGQGAPGDPAEDCDDKSPPGNNPTEASPAGSSGPVDCSIYVNDPACNSQSQPPNGLPAPTPAPASPPPPPPQPAPPAVPPSSPPADTSTPAGNGVPCGGTLGPCPGDNSDQGNKPAAPNQGAAPNNGGPLSPENPSLPALPPSSSPEGQAPNGPGATPYQSDDHDGSGSDGPSKGSDNNDGLNGQGHLDPQPPGAATAPIQPAPAGHTASTQLQGPPAQPAPPQTTDANIVGGPHEGPHLVTVIVPTQVESTETRVITVWPTDGPSMYSSTSQVKARAMADIERKRQNGQEAETTETSGLNDQKEISVASSIISAPSLAPADVPSRHTVSDIPFANSSNALDTLLSRRILIFLIILFGIFGAIPSCPVVLLIAFPMILFSRWMDWL